MYIALFYTCGWYYYTAVFLQLITNEHKNVEGTITQLNNNINNNSDDNNNNNNNNNNNIGAY